MRRVLPALAVAVLLVPLSVPSSGQAVSPSTRHFISNLRGATAPKALGYNVFDTSVSGVATLPAGVQGLVWLGQKCPTPADATFRSAVDRLAANRKECGYYLSDEPHVADCPRAAAALASRADYIRSRSRGGPEVLHRALAGSPTTAPSDRPSRTSTSSASTPARARWRRRDAP